MVQQKLSASPSATPATPATPALQALPRPRPVPLDELTPELSAVICECIRVEGISDASAGALVGVPSALLARWKAEDEGFALALLTARARFERGLMRAINDARKRDGSRDWRAQAWLLQHTSSEGIVTPARKAKAAAEQEFAAAQKHANLPETPKSPAAPPANPARENVAKLPEKPASPGQPLQPTAATPGSAARPVQNAAILPETPKAQPPLEPAAPRRDAASTIEDRR